MATPIRNVRLDNRHWAALECCARQRGLVTKAGDGDRTKLLLALMDEHIPSECWPQEAELEGQLAML